MCLKLGHRARCVKVTPHTHTHKLHVHVFIQYTHNPHRIYKTYNITYCVDVELIYASIRSHFAIDAGRLVQDFVNENRPRFVEMMAARAAAGGDDAEADRLVLCSSRTEHAEWFTGKCCHVYDYFRYTEHIMFTARLPASGHPPAMDTKEKVMRRRSQDRIRGYYYKTKDELLRSPIYKRNAIARSIVRRTLDVFAHLLAEADHFGQLFNRAWPQRHPSVPVADDDHNDNVDGGGGATATPKKRRRIAVRDVCTGDDLLARALVALCDARGQFRCQGVWNDTACAYAAAQHSINPYASREQAVLFQIWNLDHGVEIARSIIPDLLHAIEALAEGTTTTDAGMCRRHGRRGREVAMLRYFRELFTVDNLRLVHIVCHDKGVHGGRRSAGGVLCERCPEFGAVRRLCEAVATA